MSDVLMGVTLPQFTDDPERFVEGVRAAEALGFDSIWVFDHLWPLVAQKERSIIECWTALAWAAAETKSIRIGTLVTRSTLRHPAVVAKMALTVAEIAPGRVTVTIGSGDELSRPENESFGIPYFAGDQRVAQLVSTVRVVRECFGPDKVTVHDDFVTITDMPVSPSPQTAPRLWVGGRSDDVLEVAGRLCDGWNGWGGDPERFAQDAASVAGYSNGRAVEFSWGGKVMIAEDDDGARSKLGDRDPKEWLVGGPATIAARLNRYVEAGGRHLIATVPDAGRPGIYELLADARGRLG